MPPDAVAVHLTYFCAFQFGELYRARIVTVPFLEWPDRVQLNDEERSEGESNVSLCRMLN